MSASDHVNDAAFDTARTADNPRDGASKGSLEDCALQEVARQVDGAIARFSEQGLEETLADVTQFARRNPLLFLGGAALAGFAAARVLKAETPPQSAPGNDPWSGHLAAAEPRETR
ncbi:hypothetical protein [Primorskyibacter sp. 2E233]|uniref:hypothetical protein n=1 Tax=Primorskyibacter sp. 2E233 TaxID=3413431 RepID=UPI003BF2ED82